MKAALTTTMAHHQEGDLACPQWAGPSFSQTRPFQDHAVHEAAVFATGNEDYFRAVALCPSVVQDESPHDLFLAYEDHNVWRAAQRLANYWAFRVKVYGQKSAFMPLILALRPEDVENQLSKKGFCSLAHPRADGIFTLFQDRSEIAHDMRSRRMLSRMRSNFFLHQQIMMEATQVPLGGKRGDYALILRVDNARIFTTRLDRETGEFARLRSLAMCTRPVQVHFVSVDPPRTTAYSVIASLLPKLLHQVASVFLRVAITVHMGSPDEVAASMQKCGFLLDGIPACCGGNWTKEPYWEELVRYRSRLEREFFSLKRLEVEKTMPLSTEPLGFPEVGDSTKSTKPQHYGEAVSSPVVNSVPASTDSVEAHRLLLASTRTMLERGQNDLLDSADLFKADVFQSFGDESSDDGAQGIARHERELTTSSLSNDLDVGKEDVTRTCGEILPLVGVEQPLDYSSDHCRFDDFQLEPDSLGHFPIDGVATDRNTAASFTLPTDRAALSAFCVETGDSLSPARLPDEYLETPLSQQPMPLADGWEPLPLFEAESTAVNNATEPPTADTFCSKMVVGSYVLHSALTFQFDSMNALACAADARQASSTVEDAASQAANSHPVGEINFAESKCPELYSAGRSSEARAAELPRSECQARESLSPDAQREMQTQDKIDAILEARKVARRRRFNEWKERQRQKKSQPAEKLDHPGKAHRPMKVNGGKSKKGFKKV